MLLVKAMANKFGEEKATAAICNRSFPERPGSAVLPAPPACPQTGKVYLIPNTEAC